MTTKKVKPVTPVSEKELRRQAYIKKQKGKSKRRDWRKEVK